MYTYTTSILVRKQNKSTLRQWVSYVHRICHSGHSTSVVQLCSGVFCSSGLASVNRSFATGQYTKIQYFVWSVSLKCNTLLDQYYWDTVHGMISTLNIQYMVWSVHSTFSTLHNQYTQHSVHYIISTTNTQYIVWSVPRYSVLHNHYYCLLSIHLH